MQKSIRVSELVLIHMKPQRQKKIKQKWKTTKEIMSKG